MGSVASSEGDLIRYLGLILLFASLRATAATGLCGLYQVEDFGDRTIYSLIDFSSYPPTAINYIIANPRSVPVQSMVIGRCYCVIGEYQQSQAWAADTSYQNLTVERITKGPYSQCVPPR